MKKLLMVLMGLMIVLVGCKNKEKDIENKAVDNDIYTEIVDSSVVENEDNNIPTDKTYFYLIDNDLLCTVKDGKIIEKEKSIITLNDIANNSAYYNYSNIFESNEKEQLTELDIATYYTNDVVPHKDEYYDLITSSLNSGDIINRVSGEYDNWFNKRDVTTYRLPVKVNQNGEENVLDCFGVYGANIRIGNSFTTNDPGLVCIYPEAANELSEKAKEYLDKYISDNNMKVANYEVKNYSIDLDNDEKNENVYLIENRIIRTENGYTDGYDQFANDNKFSLIFLEDEGSISLIANSFLKRASNQDELWSNYDGRHREDYKVAFADFNRDGRLEMILACRAYDFEPFAVYQIIKYENNDVNVVVELEGPNH